MKERAKLETYFDMFMCIVSETRCTITSIAKSIGHTGIGRRRTTISQYLNDIYERKISFNPNLYLKNLQNIQRMAYFCEAKEKNKLGTIFDKLKADKRINYVLLNSGYCDFFCTSRDPELDLTSYGLTIIESSVLYSPIYTIPQGWKLSFKDAAKNILKYNFKKGNLPRKEEGVLDWQEIDMRIFELMKEDARRPFTEVARETGVFSQTVKNHFYNHVLPWCNVAHYFFPKGYDAYMKNQIRIYTKYEQSLVHSLKRLPCTTYVYPLEKGLLIDIFHENINIVMTIFGKMEEMGVIDYYAQLTPLWYYHI